MEKGGEEEKKEKRKATRLILESAKFNEDFERKRIFYTEYP